MDETEEHGNAFAIPDLWKSSSFPQLQHETGQLIEEWDALNYKLDQHDSPSEGHENSSFSNPFFDLCLTDLSSFEYGPCPSGTLELSSTNDSVEGAAAPSDAFGEAEILDDDPWADVQLMLHSEKPCRLKSWEAFFDRNFEEPRTTYLSEGGPSVLDAALNLPHRNADGPLEKENGRVLTSSSMLLVSNNTKNS